jgi:hypothetical protein
MTALRPLLAGSIDYAGLFPPAGLDMPTAVANYAAYRESDASWALGRFVVPVARLAEFEAATEAALGADPARQGPWRLSALLGNDVGADMRVVEEFNCRHADSTATRVLVDVIEGKADTAEGVASVLQEVPGTLQAYVEIPIVSDPYLLIAEIAGGRGRAKIRTGGVTADVFPPSAQVVRFIGACISVGVPFKATAGLHHPLRAEYPLTYAADSPRGTMFGFLNVFLATAFMAQGLDAITATLLLEESSPASIRVSEETIEWRGRRVSAAAIEAARSRAIVSFGSCSFTEPIGDLTALGLL